MEVIISHNNTDFDGLAAMIAAKRLYPDAELVFPGKLCRNVQEFMALHKDTLGIRTAKDIPMDQITRMILVDTKSKTRIGIFGKLIDKTGVEIHVFDHHPSTADDVQSDLIKQGAVGAVTTIMVELIRQRKISLCSFEATILALGIYEDTGCLTFSTTTARDAEAVAYLLAQGANLAVVADFIGRPLTENQKSLLNTLLVSAKHYLINGIRVIITTASIDEFVGGLALLTHKLGDIESLDVVIAVVHMEDRVHMVARSRIDTVNVQQILEPFGGGGHEKAASATVKDGDLGQLVEKLHEVLKEKIKPMITAAQLMSAPVKTVSPTTTIDEAGKIMLRYGHSGMPVVEGMEMVGVISRRDLDKANHHGLGHAPVKGYMSRNVITIDPQAPLGEIQRLLIEHNIGRLPVIDQGKIAGIVSRTDVLRCLHGKDYPEKYQTVYLTDQGVGTERTIKEIMRENLSEKLRQLLAKISFIAHDGGFQVYVVGGFVRDLLLRVENLDIDLVVEGDGIAFAKVLAEHFCGRVRTHDKFGTAVVVLPDGFKLDVATARTEYYEYPAALPKVETSSLRQDLYRRDFTVNAMAIDLNRDHFGELIDFFGGRKDIEKKVIRILYNLSFVEDPTRIFRAIRFEQRYKFEMEPQTFALAKRAIKDNWLTKLSYDRIRAEIRHIFNEDYPINAINRMRELGLWKIILPEVTVDEETRLMLDRIPEIMDSVQQKVGNQQNLHPWLVYFVTMIHKVNLKAAQDICLRFRMTKEEVRIMIDCLEHWQTVVSTLRLPQNPDFRVSLAAKSLRKLPLEAYVFILTKVHDAQISELIYRYLEISTQTYLAIDGDDLKALGYAPGPLYKQVLEQVYDGALDGLVTTREEQLQMASKCLKESEGE